MKRMILALAAVLAGCAYALDRSPLAEFPARTFHIGAYCLKDYAHTEQHVKDIADCGVDFIAAGPKYNRELLDLFQKYGIGMCICGQTPGWWGGDGSRAGKMHEVCPLEKYDELAKGYVDHPAVWGIDIGDEPSALDFPHYSNVVEKVQALYPRVFPYLNLYPNYASVAANNGKETVNQLGTPTYAEHIEQYCRQVPLPYICYDFYVYSINVDRMYDNFRIVSDAARRYKKDFWYVLQVNSHKQGSSLTENQLRYQAYLGLAYGAKKIIWACWTKGWWYDNVLDEQGEKTAQYDKLKKINAELRRYGDIRVKYDWVGTDIKDGFAIGKFAAIGSVEPTAYFVVSVDDPYDKNPTTRKIKVAGVEVELQSNGAKWIEPSVSSADGEILPIPPLQVTNFVVHTGLDEPFSVLHVSDSHLVRIDSRDDDALYAFAKSRSRNGRELGEYYLDQAIHYARGKGLPIIHTGDFMEFSSFANRENAGRRLATENILACVGNHEYWQAKNGEMQYQTMFDENGVNPLRKSFIGFPCERKLIHGVNFLFFDDALGRVSPKVSAMFDRLVAEKRPIVLVCHVPPYLEGLGIALYCGEKPNQVDAHTRRFVEKLRKEPLVKAVLCGHMHAPFHCYISPSAVQFTAGALFLGGCQEIRFVK